MHRIESSNLELAPLVGCCEHSHGTGASTMQGINLMNVKHVYSLDRNDPAPCSQLNSRLALYNAVLIPLHEPTSPTHHTTLTIPTGTQT